MSSVIQGPLGVNWSVSLGAPGPIILHLFGPSAFESGGRDLPFSLPVSLLFAYGALIGSWFPWLPVPQWVLGSLTGIKSLCGRLAQILLLTG